MHWLRRWWRQPDHFDWITGYLRARGMLGMARLNLACSTAALALIPAVLTMSSRGPHGGMAQAVTWLSVLGGLGAAAMWVGRWPTRRLSVAYIVSANLFIALACYVQDDPMIGLMGCTVFATTGGYIALFHTPGYMIYNFAVALYVGVLQSVRLATESADTALAAALLLLVVVLNIAVPFAVQAVVHVLGVDLLRANRDPLTGLLNRRAVYQQIEHLLTAHRDQHVHLAVAVVDLDDFKLLNDSHGHAAGDQALVAVARALRTGVSQTAVVGRLGGEEFLLADLLEAGDIDEWAQRMCAAVAIVPFRLTASVGVAAVCLPLFDEDGQAVIHTLIGAADHAMYAAKRAGGNQFRHDDRSACR
ncbi:GGDEF domain-containing protein [Mycolicibacterium baixiangningiae]|uniref:GGDEF domain-containing protein n=1 Tax=Mycolicibacterium baixiangningiae TaxID=2761578 RepID=UPI0018685907|nr:GGDEF domain-containing protein [Mycolicibacterium baixiangningiae]